MKYTLTLLLLIFSVHTYSIKNWLPYINNISRMEYGGGTQNWTITRDNNGWIYAANNSGLLQFDGYSWHLFSNGMIIRTAYHDGKERIYVGAFNNFGYFSPDEKGAMHYHSLSDSLEDKYRNFSDVWDIYCIDHSIYFVSYNHILSPSVTFRLSTELFCRPDRISYCSISPVGISAIISPLLIVPI